MVFDTSLGVRSEGFAGILFGSLWGTSWPSNGVLLNFLGRMGRILGHLGGVLEHLGGHLGCLGHDFSCLGNFLAIKNGPMLVRKSSPQWILFQIT